MAEDAIVAQYIVKTDAAIAQLNALNARISAIESNSRKSGKGVEDAFTKMTNGLNNQFKQLGASIAAAFAVDRVIQFGKEAVQLSAKAEGVERAFARIGSPELLDGLRRATKGTVSDLNLMTAAVRASNFKIPLEQMGTLLEFARRRAAETGESVDYLVESIVVGIGRKSPLILDNLGISAVELRKRFNGISVEAAEVGDVAKIVGDIATEELQKMGADSQTTAVRLAQITAEFENMKTEVGAALINVGDFLISAARGGDSFAMTLAEIMSTPSDDMIAALEKINKQFQDKSITDAIDARKKVVSELTEELIRAEQFEKAGKLVPSQTTKRIEELELLQNAFEQYIDQRRRAAASGVMDDVTPEQADAIAKRIKTQKEEIRNIFFLTNAIKALNEEKEREGTTRERILQINEELKPLEEDLAFLQGKMADKTKDSNKALEEYLATIEKFNRGIEIWQNKQLEIIDAQSDIDRLYTMRTVFDAEDRADALTEIEKARLRKRIELMKSFGRDTISEQIKLEQIEIDGREQLMKEMAALEKRFRDGMDEDYEKSLELRKKKLEEFAAFEAEMRAEQLELFNGVSSFIMQTIGQVSQYEQQEAQRRYAVVDELLEKQLISEEDAAERKKRIARDEAKKNKELAIFAAIIGTAQSVVNAMATAPNYIVGAIFAALAGIAGGIQIATIENEPLPSFGEGGFVEDGWIKGRSHGQGGVKLEAEGGEFIVNKKSAHKYSDLLEAINEDRPTLAPPKGWENLAQSIAIQQAFNDQNLLRAIDRHREGEVGLLRDLLTEVKKSNGRPLRGGYHA